MECSILAKVNRLQVSVSSWDLDPRFLRSGYMFLLCYHFHRYFNSVFRHSMIRSILFCTS